MYVTADETTIINSLRIYPRQYGTGSFQWIRYSDEHGKKPASFHGPGQH
jgi:hypothetical protein